MYQMVVSDNKLGNYDDGSAYTRVVSFERSLIFKCPNSLLSEFRDGSARETYSNLKMNWFCIEQMLL